MENQAFINNVKIYIAVNEDRLPDGTIFPRVITWEDGVRYEIDSIIDIRKAASLRGGGAGIRYLIRIGETETYMWLEEDRWFVERRRPN